MKPLKASQITDIYALKYPVLCSPKYDGIRAITTHKGFLSNSLKPLPNKQLQSDFLSYPNSLISNFLDGELTLEDPTASFNEVQSLVMSQDKVGKLVYRVFDEYFHTESPYENRLMYLRKEFTDIVELSPTLSIKLTPQVTVNSPEQLLNLEEGFTHTGYEGVMVRSPYGIYKFGRSTLKEGYLLKLKRFEDSEAIVVGFNELLLNHNDPQINELGLQVRPSLQAGKVASGMLGSLEVDHPLYGQFSIGTGFTHTQRKEIWQSQSLHLGVYAKFKYLNCSIKDKPRHPVFLGFRDERDLSN